MPPRQERRITIRLPAEILEKLEQEAESIGCSVKEVIMFILRGYRDGSQDTH